MDGIRIEEQNTDREALLGLLLLADPCEALVREYLTRGRLFVLWEGGEARGVLHLDPIDERSVEIRNIAVREASQGRGYGKALLAAATAACRACGMERVVVHTGNSSIGNLAFYQKAGFRIVAVEPDYFVHHYPEPISEHGIPCRDRIRLQLNLSDGSGQEPLRYRAVLAHTRSYSDPIVVAWGEAVTVGDADPDWPGWLWCTSGGGKSGWVPEQLIDRDGERGVMRADYSALELTVAVGEMLQGLRELNGWIWCRKSDGQEGWVPVRNLQQR